MKHCVILVSFVHTNSPIHFYIPSKQGQPLNNLQSSRPQHTHLVIPLYDPYRNLGLCSSPLHKTYPILGMALEKKAKRVALSMSDWEEEREKRERRTRERSVLSQEADDERNSEL